MPKDQTPTTSTPENADTKKKVTISAKAHRARTATAVTYALTALLCFMAVWTLTTGVEDKNGVIAGSMIVATGAIQFYFGTKNGGTNG